MLHSHAVRETADLKAYFVHTLVRPAESTVDDGSLLSALLFHRFIVAPSSSQSFLFTQPAW